MTPAQLRRYWRHWNVAWSAHWAGVRGGEPVARVGRPVSELREQLVALAGQIAGPGALRPDHLRHACHLLALGRDRRSAHLTSKEQDLVIAIFQRLAAAGHELAGQIRSDARETELDRRRDYRGSSAAASGPRRAWEQRRPDADRKRVLWSLEHSLYPRLAIEEIARDKFGTSDWRSLDDRRLYQLLITVKGAERRRTRATATVPQRRCQPAAVLESAQG